MMESQSTLARLLAKENIEIQHGNFRTAFFDVENRVLGLPIWKDRGKDVYDLLVGHEVGHALFTPAEGWHDSTNEIPGIPRSFVNVVEDVRIEKLVQRTYPGLVSSFKRGYSVLNSEDFFQTAGRDLSSYNVVDRINIKAKLRDLVEVPFSANEMPIVKQVMSVETWADVIEACRALYDFVAQDKKDQDETIEYTPSETNDADQDSSESIKSTTSQMDDLESRAEDTEEPETASGSSQSDTQSDEEITVETDEAFRENEDKLLYGDGADARPVFANGVSKEQALSSITSYKELAAERETHINNAFNNIDGPTQLETDLETDLAARFEIETKNVVNVMAKEFEMRKAAYRSSRSQTSRSGSIDVNRLHSYKYNDDIFARVTQLADAKSHGMVMFVDYSGSMHRVLRDIIKQTVTLVDFCRKVNIPFEVYGFTTPGDYGKRVAAVPGNIALYDCNIFELVSSNLSKRDFTEARGHLVKQCSDTSYRGNISNKYFCQTETLGGTPLNETILVAEHVIKDFQSRNSVQKTNVVFLTDGDGHHVSVHSNRYEEEKSSTKNGIIVKMCNSQVSVNRPWQLTDALMTKLKTIPGVTTTGFFVCEKIMDLRNQAYNCNIKSSKLSEITREYNKNKVVVFGNVRGYDKYFMLKGDKMSTDTDELKVSSHPTKGEITRAFKKHAASKKGNRVLAVEFAKMVA